MATVKGIITKDVTIEKIDMSPIKIGAWAHVDQGEGKICSGLICNHKTLGYCYINEDKLERGTLVEMTGIKILREDKDFMIVDEGFGIKIIN